MKNIEVFSNKINQLFQYCNYINSGGCGLFALCLGQTLKKKFSIQYAFCSSDKLNNEELFNEEMNKGNIKSLYDINNFGAFCNHILVLINNKHLIDCTGITNEYQVDFFLNESTLKSITDKNEGWNEIGYEKTKNNLKTFKNKLEKLLN